LGDDTAIHALNDEEAKMLRTNFDNLTKKRVNGAKKWFLLMYVFIEMQFVLHSSA
jgi:hypothetical protein